MTEESVQVEEAPTHEEVKARLEEIRTGEEPVLEDQIEEPVEEAQAEEEAEQVVEESEDDDSTFLFQKQEDGSFVPKGKFVPQGKFNEAREQAKQAQTYQEQLNFYKQQAESNAAQVQQMQQIFQDMTKGDEPKEEFDPLDPDAYERTNGEIGKLREQLDQLSKTQQTNAYLQMATQQKAQFAAQNPDYDKALEHLGNVKVAEAKFMGLAEDQAKHYAVQEIAKIGARAFQNNQNMAHALYETAKGAGYKKTSEGPNTQAISENKAKTHSAIDSVKNSSPALEGVQQSINQSSFEKSFVRKDANGNIVGVDREKLAQARAKARRQA